MEEIIKEKLNPNFIEPVSIEISEKIIWQMKKCVCKIYIKGTIGTGFFTKIPYNNNFLNVLITNNHILGENEIKNDTIITITLNNETERKLIKINDKRKRYTNEILDVTIIEIEDKKDGIYDYIELDEEIMNIYKINNEEIINNFKDMYMNRSIYILNYLNGDKIVVSYGLILDIKGKDGIYHQCNTNRGSSGSPILSLKNNKLIGIHYGTATTFNYNKGTLIIYPIIEFQKITNNLLIIKKIKLNEMTIIYNIKNKDTIKLFGKEFIKNNKDNCKLIIEGKEHDLIEHLDINKKIKNKEILEIKLKEINAITNMSHMFGDDKNNNCSELISLPDFNKWNTTNITNLSHIFSYCKSLSSLPDISNWDTSKVTDMSGMFKFCSSLSSLPDITKWDTKSVINISNMFCGCTSLSKLPDISKWNTQNVTDMNSMFNFCKSLSTLPDISKWNTQNVINMRYMFCDCRSLSTLPDISKWNTQNVTDMENMFYRCESLTTFPDISKWNTQNVTDMANMFYRCESLSTLPDISKWNTHNVNDMKNMFSFCKTLSTFPDISKWNTHKVDMNNMFKGCESLSLTKRK